jgi:hypothetical protein
MVKTAIACVGAALLIGCSALQNKVMVSTQTVLGFDLSQNPSTQMYQLKFGYARNEFALVPTNGPDVITEINYRNVTGNGGLYQRMAVGRKAVEQSVLMFAKDADGALDPAVAKAVTSSVNSIPAVNTSTLSSKAELSDAYKNATDRAKFDEAAKQAGYADFVAFLMEANTSMVKLETVKSALKGTGAIQ